MDRRTFLRGAVALGVASFGASFWRQALGGPATPGPSPYGPLGAADANGVRLPAGFSVRELARSGTLVPGAAYRWHTSPDGGATYATPDGGWVYACNAEIDLGLGGAGALRFDSSGAIVDAYPILAGTSRNCAGGATPWGTWLSCEETTRGRVWECDPLGIAAPTVRNGLGWFSHEAAAVDPLTNKVYLTEDESNGRLYRFTPSADGGPAVLDAGVLEVARWSADGTVTWIPVPAPNPIPLLHDETRSQVLQSTSFSRGEGAWFDTVARTLYFVTTSDARVWAHDVDAGTLEILYDGRAHAANRLKNPDNITVHPSGELYICEDGDDIELHVLTPEGVIAPVLQLTGTQHLGSELAGVAFDPSGARMYVSSQRGYGSGVTYEITGPFGASAS